MFVGGGGMLEAIDVVDSEREAGESFLDFDDDEDGAFGFCFGLSSLESNHQRPSEFNMQRFSPTWFLSLGIVVLFLDERSQNVLAIAF